MEPKGIIAYGTRNVNNDDKLKEELLEIYRRLKDKEVHVIVKYVGNEYDSKSMVLLMERKYGDTYFVIEGCDIGYHYEICSEEEILEKYKESYSDFLEMTSKEHGGDYIEK